MSKTDLTVVGIVHGVNTYKACPKCTSTEHLEVRKYDRLWRDGEVWCSKCNVKVRDYDAS